MCNNLRRYIRTAILQPVNRVGNNRSQASIKDTVPDFKVVYATPL
jgi:hypothetical protein